MNITAVERDTGLSKDTLRVWERRYGFPAPRRDATGQRVYSPGDIEKLRLAKRLLDHGYRPGKILRFPAERLMEMAQAVRTRNGAEQAAAAAADSADVAPVLALLQAHRVEALHEHLEQCLARLGLAQFLAAVIAPLNAQVGEAWARGHLEVFEEHLYTEVVQGIVRAAIAALPRPGPQAPQVLLTTFPNESHGLGLLMAEAFFTLEDCHCISLGTQTPLRDIVRAAAARHADIVALSFSAAMNANHTVQGLAELRAQLPAGVALWAGGACPILERRTLAGVTRLPSLTDIGPALERWRRGQDSSA